MFNAGRILRRSRGQRARSGRGRYPPVWLKIPKKYKRQQQRLLAARRRQLNTALSEPFEESTESISKKPYPFVWQALVASLIGFVIFAFGVFLCFLGFRAEHSRENLEAASYDEFLLGHHEEQAQLRQQVQQEQAHLFMDREKYDVVYVRNLKNVVYKVFNSNKMNALQEHDKRKEGLGKMRNLISVISNSTLKRMSMKFNAINENKTTEMFAGHIEAVERANNKLTTRAKIDHPTKRTVQETIDSSTNSTDPTADDNKSTNDRNESQSAPPVLRVDKENSDSNNKHYYAMPNFRFLIYFGPLVMSVGVFFIILSFVVVCELREKVKTVPVDDDTNKYYKKLSAIFRNSGNFKYVKEDLNFFKAVVYPPCLKFEMNDVDNSDGLITDFAANQDI